MSEPTHLRIQGARQHNLKNVTLALPRNKLIVMTGPSGSGKSSLAFDTLFAEGQRRYVQSLSSYARQFLDQTEKPDVDSIEGLSPAVAIEQRNTGSSPRSTVATSTEIYDYLRVLYSSIGVPHHPKTGRPLRRWTVQELVDLILEKPASDRFMVLAPVVRGEKGEFRDVLDRLRKEGFIRARIDGVLRSLDEQIKLDKKSDHLIEAVVDRLKVADSIRTRLTDSLELALRLGQGIVTIAWPTDVIGPETPPPPDWHLSNQNFDPETGYHFPEITPRHFSFNSPQGACPVCHGLGTELMADADLMVPDPSKTLEEGAIAPWEKAHKSTKGHYRALLQDLAAFAKVPMNRPWTDLPESFKDLILNGSKDIPIPSSSEKGKGKERPFEGLVAQVQHLHDESESQFTKLRLRPFMNRLACPACHGKRLRPEILAVTLPASPSQETGQKAPNIHDFTGWSVRQSLDFLTAQSWDKIQQQVAGEILHEIINRLRFLADVGLGYLTLNREMNTLSGGESQRIRLATQIGSGLTGVLYILDEPSIGLHQRDNDRLLQTIQTLRDQGNTVVVVEHDEDTIRAADYLVDLGPGAGARGGYIVAEGTVEEVSANPKSVTGGFLSGRSKLAVPKHRTPAENDFITVRGARENNLKNIDASFPIGCFTCVTGVSGSGKSTLVNNILSHALFRHFYGSKDKPGAHDRIEGLERIDKVVIIDQSPIGRTPRSNPLTYSGAFNGIRDLFAQLPAARIRGYGPGRFSFNTPGGRCEHCEGDGALKIEMHFLPDVYVPCEVCKGRRFNRETLEISYKGHNIADVLDLTVNEGLDLFKNIPGVHDKLEAMARVGLGYLPMGQSATTLSGGEAQRIKLAAELAKRATGRTCFIMDEPTTGLHFTDIEQLLQVLFELRNSGNTLIVIEHQLDVIKSADWIIDLGPEGGTGGGTIVATGTPEMVAKNKASHTGKFLARLL